MTPEWGAAPLPIAWGPLSLSAPASALWVQVRWGMQEAGGVGGAWSSGVLR